MLALNGITPQDILDAPKELCILNIFSLLWSWISGISPDEVNCMPDLTPIQLFPHILIYRIIPLLVIILFIVGVKKVLPKNKKAKSLK